MKPFLSETTLIIPALNEAACVASTVGYWRGLGAARVRVVDNGSSDNTADCALAAGAEVVDEPLRGYGAAAWRGLQNLPVQTEFVLFSSADGSDRLNADELAEWQSAIDAGADLVVGDRCSAAASRQHLKWVQSFGNRLCCGLIALGWGVRFNDLGSLRLVRRRAIEALDLKDRGFGWNVEMQVRALERRMKIVELPVSYFPRAAGESKISGNLFGTCKAGWGILKMVASLWLTKSRPTAVKQSRAPEPPLKTA